MGDSSARFLRRRTSTTLPEACMYSWPCRLLAEISRFNDSGPGSVRNSSGPRLGSLDERDSEEGILLFVLANWGAQAVERPSRAAQQQGLVVRYYPRER